jgi:hypothetical protein
VDWVVRVHFRFRLLPDTLYLAINIIDRYFKQETLQKKKTILVGATSLLLACKYEEKTCPPELTICACNATRGHEYTLQDVLDVEAHIAKTLHFRMTVPTGYPFLLHFVQLCKATETANCLANFYMERMLQEHSALKYRPSLLAATAVCLSMNNPDALEAEGIILHNTPVVVSLLCQLWFDGTYY